MPELPEVETTRRGIAPALVGATLVDVVVRERRLRWALPPGFEASLRGQPMTSVGRRAKYLLIAGPGGTLLAHLGMSGSFRVVPPGTALSALWPRVWELSGVGPGNDEISDGMELWWLASQCGAEQLVAPAAPSELADEALSEWLKFFARGEFD